MPDTNKLANSLDQHAIDTLNRFKGDTTSKEPVSADEVATKIWQKYFGDYAFVTRDGLRPLIAHEFVEELSVELKKHEIEAKIQENDYHWHHQKFIERRAATGQVSGYFLDRKAELEAKQERA